MRIKEKARKLKPVKLNEAAEDECMRIIIIDLGGFPTALLVDSIEEVIKITADKLKRLPDEAATAISRGHIREYISGVAMLDKSDASTICSLAGMAGPEDERAVAGGA